MFKDFLENILSGKIKYNDVEDHKEKINIIEKDLNDLNDFIKSKKIDVLKDYIKKINYLVYGKDKKRLKPIKQNLMKIKKKKDMSIYLLLYLKYILIIVQKN